MNKAKFYKAFNCIFGKIGRIVSEKFLFINSAMRHSLQFALNRVLFNIFGALSKDTYKDICKYFGIMPIDEQISARQIKFYLRYCASESAVCHAISKLR